MDIFQDLEAWQQLRQSLPESKTLGFVPTMGNLHKGHASLFDRSLQENDVTVVSLFINPTQFNRADDFKHYPRTLDEDVALLKSLGVDYCLLPNEKAMYQDNYRYQLHENEQSLAMEGTHRPGHFNGVLTVVMKLLNLARPHRAYFGEKDYQQYLLIQDMVKAFFMNIDIIPCPIIREDSGLACSSRNNRLNEEQRQKADEFASIFHQNKALDLIHQALLEAGIQVDYLEEQFNRRFAAVLIDDIRLIDNYLMS